MSAGTDSRFSIGEWRVEPELNRISLGSQTTALRPQVMELLVYLAQQEGRVVSAEELLDNLWTGKIVSGNTVYNCVAELRHALADGRDATPYVETVPRKGYRLLAPVTPAPDSKMNVRSGFSNRIMYTTAALATLTSVVLAFAWLSRQSAQETPSSTTQTSVATFDVPGPADSRGASGLLLPLHLPEYADNSSNYAWPNLALSPDGRQIAYVGFADGDIHLYLKRADAAQARRLALTSGASAPFFSPDGDWVGFFADGNIMRVHTDGGDPLLVGPVPGVPTGATWASDGYIYFAVGYRSYLQRIHSGGGPVEDVTRLAKDERTHRSPHALPDGKSLLFQFGSPDSIMQSEPAEIWVLDAGTGKRAFLMEGANPKYSNGSLIYRRVEAGGYSVWRVDLDLDSLALSGLPAPLITTPTETFDVSRSGALHYVQSRQVERSILRLVDVTGSTELLVSDKPVSQPRFSNDDRMLAVSIGSKNQADTWVYFLDGRKPPAQLTTDNGAFHTWSAEGDRIAYYRWAEGIFSQSVHASAPPERLVDIEGFVIPLDWTADGLLFLRPDPVAEHVVFFQSNDGLRQPITTHAIVPVNAEISPNGRWLAYSRMDAGRPDVVVQAYPAGQRVWRVSADLAGDHPKWSRNGRSLYFESFNRLMVVAVDEGNPVSFGAPRAVVEFSGRSDITMDPFDVTSDGARLAVVDTIYGTPPEHVYISDWRKLR